MVKTAISHIHTTLETFLGENLITLYRYRNVGDPYFQPERSDENLLAVVADEVDLHQLREALLPIWEESGSTRHQPPLIASHAAFRRHLHFFPLFAHHLVRHGECVTGAGLYNGDLANPNASERASYLAHQALLASSALVPELLSHGEAEKAYTRLHKLAEHLTGNSFPETTPVAELFTEVQVALRELVENLPSQPPASVVRLVDSPDEPNLQAVYNETDHTVCILPELSARLLREIDWAPLAERLQPHHTSLQVTTANQLRLILQSEAALEFALGRYEHEWGLDPLADLQVSLWAVWRNAGRLPSRLLIDDVPGAYLTARDEEAMHKVVHDYQNRLLNMRLQHELFHRLHNFEAAVPPYDLPGRNEPVSERIDAILVHLDWWADYYFQQMQNTVMSEKIPAA